LNDAHSLWPRACEGLHACNPAMHAIVVELFGDEPETPASPRRWRRASVTVPSSKETHHSDSNGSQ